MQVRDILEIKGTVLFTTTPQQTLDSAVAAMAENDVGSLVVMGGGKMVGLLTFREVLKAVHARQGDISTVKVEEVMLPNPTIATPKMETNDLRRLLLGHHQRYVPVMDGTLLMGVLSFMDVAKAVLEEQSFENKMLKNYIKNWPDEEGVE
ncbi:MAG TPA: CBS domain-containing protein [Azospira sp.]|nr:CBS domain-containing protein [Azospira sp.]